VLNSSEKTVSEKLYVPHGHHIVKWIYQNVNYESEHDVNQFTIHQIMVFGAEEGGADKCLDCIDGFISNPGDMSCDPCSPGSESNSLHTECDSCSGRRYSSWYGAYEGCLECAKHTRPNVNHTACIGPHYLDVDFGHEIFIQNLTGLSGDDHGYKEGICT
jgi:hypothetical protein